MPKSFTKNYCAKNVVSFKGVDEVAWIKDFKPTKIAGLKKPLIVVRQIETKAAYAQGKQDHAKTLAEKLADLGNVHLIERYNDEGNAFGVKEGFVDSANLVANADLVVSYGGTIAREAALQGVPSIAISDMAKTYVNTYLAKKGFPLFITTEQRVLGYAKKYLGKRFDVKEKLAELENPVEVIEKVVENLKLSESLSKRYFDFVPSFHMELFGCTSLDLGLFPKNHGYQSAQWVLGVWLVHRFCTMASLSETFCSFILTVFALAISFWFMFVIMLPKPSTCNTSPIKAPFLCFTLANSGVTASFISGPNSEGSTPISKCAATGAKISLP